MPRVVEESQLPKRRGREGRDYKEYVDGKWREFTKEDFGAAKPESFVANAQAWGRKNNVKVESRRDGAKVFLLFKRENGKPATKS